MNNVDAILDKHGRDRQACIKVLQEIQRAFGFLPREVLRYVAEHSQITDSQIYGVSTFYERFRFHPIGKHLVRCCCGTACHVNGAKSMSRTLEEILKIKDRETTSDGLFTRETVACLGCCSLAPVMMVDSTVYGRLTTKEIRRILKQYQHQALAEARP